MPCLLIIDDDPSLTELLSKYLDHQGHNTHFAQMVSPEYNYSTITNLT